MKNRTNEYIDDFFNRFPEMNYLRENLVNGVNMLVALKENNKLLLCGNGGSAADCEHIAGEFLKSFVLKRQVDEELKSKLISEYSEDGEFMANNLQCGIKAIPLTSFCAYNTAFLNDCNDKMLFAQLVNSLGVKDDVLIAISTSGNSANVVYAVKLAKVMGIKVIALTGEKGGKLKDLADVILNVPSNETYRIQEYHLPIYHLICLCVESELFDM